MKLGVFCDEEGNWLIGEIENGYYFFMDRHSEAEDVFDPSPLRTRHSQNYTLAVSTNGKAPAAAAYLRDKIETDLPSFSKMVELQETIRSELKNTVPEQKRRAEILRAVMRDDAVWKALDSNDFDAALNLARRNI